MDSTIKDVAKTAGVSVATVSRVLNKSANVSDITAKRVLSAIETLGYRPNFLGRNLRKCETNVILAIIPSMEHTFYSGILKGMQNRANELGYDILISTSNSDNATELRLLNMLANRTVDAAILLGTRLPADVLKELSAKYCMALCCERIPESDMVTVTVDDEQAGYDAVKCLIEKGHRKIAMVSTSVRAYSSIDRENGYKKALAEYGIPFREDYMYYGSYDYWSGETAMEQFMNLEKKPTAVFTVSDLLATGVIRYAEKHDIKIGKDLAVIGFDNIALAEMFIPSISTVVQPCMAIGYKAVEMVIENLRFPNTYKGKNYFLKHNIILRQSTGD